MGVVAGGVGELAGVEHAPIGADLMRVRFSPDIFRIERFGGVTRYIVELHRGLVARGVDSRILAGLHRNEYVAGDRCRAVHGRGSPDPSAAGGVQSR